MTDLPLFRRVMDLTRFWEKSLAMVPHTLRYDESLTRSTWGRPGERNITYSIGAFWHNTNRDSHRAGFGTLHILTSDAIIPVTDPSQLTYGQLLQLPRSRANVSFNSGHKIGGQRTTPYRNPENMAKGELREDDFGGTDNLAQMLIDPRYVPPGADGWYRVRE